MNDSSTVLWALADGDERVSCAVRLTPDGIEIDIAHNGEVVVTRAFERDTEALAWAGGKRAAREARGWRPVALPPTRKV
jgi:hypothetical protein